MSDVLGTIAQGVNPLTTMGQVVNVMRGAQDFKTQQFALQQARLQPALSGLMALRMQTKANGGPGVTWDDINANLADSARIGGDISGLTDDVNAAMGRGENPDDVVRSTSIRGMPSFEQFGAVTPESTVMNLGGVQVPVTIGARGGPTPGALQIPGGGLTGLGMTLTPEQRAQTVTVPDPTGRGGPISMSMGEAIDRGLWTLGGAAGAGGGAGGAGAPAAAGRKEAALTNIAMRESGMQNVPNAQGSGAEGYFQIMPQTWKEGAALAGVDLNQYPHPMAAPFPVQYAVASALYDQRGTQPWAASAANAGKFPGAWAVGAQGGGPGSYQVAGNAPVAPPGAGAGGFYGQGGGVIVNPPAGTQEMIKGSTGRAQDLIASQTQTLATRAILAGMETDINTRGFVSGTGSSSYGTLRQLLQNYNISPQAMDIKQGQAAQEQFQKFSYQLQAQQMQMLGAPSDARQEMSEASNPSMKLSPAGNLKIVHMLAGNQQAIDVMARSFAASGQPPGAFDSWRQQFTARDKATGGEFDPRVFWLSNMTPQEQQEYAKTTQRGNPKAWEQLSNNLQFAKSQGWITQGAGGSITSDW